MPSVGVELRSIPAVDDASSWQEEIAAGQTIGMLLARMVNERSSVETLFDPARRRLAPGITLTLNGRNYELMGGLTALLSDDDRLGFRPHSLADDRNPEATR